MEKNTKDILILTTGGTIGSIADPIKGIRPGNMVIGLMLKEMGFEMVYGREANHYVSEGISIRIEELMNKDSTDMTAKDQAEIAKAIFEKRHGYEGIVVTHGTDTMHFLSSMLSLMLKDVDKPVAITGAMRIPEDKRSDAVKNLGQAISFAAGGMNGIFVVFHGNVMEGPWVYEINPGELSAFESTNGYIAKIIYKGIDYRMERTRVHRYTSLDARYDDNVVSINLFPGIKSDTIIKSASEKRGVVVVGYGSGGFPVDIVETVGVLATQMPVVLTAHSPNKKGLPGTYEVSRRVNAEGIIIGHGLQSLDTSNLIFTLGITPDGARLGKIRKVYMENLERLKREAFRPITDIGDGTYDSEIKSRVLKDVIREKTEHTVARQKQKT